MSKTIEQPMYFPDPGDRLRIVIRHENVWRPIFWFKVSRDGSLYLGPRYKKVSTLKSGAGNKEDDQIRFSYSRKRI